MAGKKRKITRKSSKVKKHQHRTKRKDRTKKKIARKKTYTTVRRIRHQKEPAKSSKTKPALWGLWLLLFSFVILLAFLWVYQQSTAVVFDYVFIVFLIIARNLGLLALITAGFLLLVFLFLFFRRLFRDFLQKQKQVNIHLGRKKTGKIAYRHGHNEHRGKQNRKEGVTRSLLKSLRKKKKVMNGDLQSQKKQQDENQKPLQQPQDQIVEIPVEDKIVKDEKQAQEEISSREKQPLLTGAFSSETEIDRLYQKIQQKGKIKLSDVVKQFRVSSELAEEWAAILENHHLIEIQYPTFGSVILVHLKTKTKKESEEKA